MAPNPDGIPEAFAAAAYGKLVKRGSVEELAAAMLDWAQKPRPDLAARREMHVRVAERFSLKRAASELANLYSEVLATK